MPLWINHTRTAFPDDEVNKKRQIKKKSNKNSKELVTALSHTSAMLRGKDWCHEILHDPNSANGTWEEDAKNSKPTHIIWRSPTQTH